MQCSVHINYSVAGGLAGTTYTHTVCAYSVLYLQYILYTVSATDINIFYLQHIQRVLSAKYMVYSMPFLLII